MLDSLESSARAAAQKRVDAIARLALAARVTCATRVTHDNTTYEGIINAAKKHKCDLIFMASHGRSGLAKLIMGSVTQKVLAQVRLPVVVYR
jgi:nucleotide-binding universal stress UspA family protein